MSKRTFYEHFDGKVGCLLACYAEASEQLLLRMQDTGRDLPPGVGRIEVRLADYLGALDLNPPLAVALLVEIQAAGEAGRRLRRESNQRFAAAIHDLVTEAIAELDLEGVPTPAELGTFDPVQSTALVGGLNEIILQHAETTPDVPFRTLAPAATRFVCAVLGVPTD